MDLEELFDQTPCVREAIEEEQYTIWPHDSSSGIEHIVFAINPQTHKIDMHVYYDRNVVGAFKIEHVLNKTELESLKGQIRRLQIICKDRYGVE